jgi:hypothetical protein
VLTFFFWAHQTPETRDCIDLVHRGYFTRNAAGVGRWRQHQIDKWKILSSVAFQKAVTFLSVLVNVHWDTPKATSTRQQFPNRCDCSHMYWESQECAVRMLLW